MPDFGILLDPPLPSAPEESVSSSLALISCPNLEVPCESDTQMQELVSDRNSLLGFPILMKEDELKPEINGCVELVQKEDELKQLTPKSSDSDIQMQEIVSDRNSQLGFPSLLKEDELKLLTPKSSESDTQMQELVSDRNSQLGFPILLKEDDLKLENNECVELEQKEDELKLLTPKSSESDTQMQEMVSDRESQLALPILLKEDELKPENNGCVELEQKDELKLENNGCGELGIRILIPKSSQSNTQTEELVSDPNSQRGFPILPKEDELKLENNGYGELGIRDLISKSSQSDTQMQELVSDQNSQLGFSFLQKEELKPDNNGCVELEQKDDKLKLENNGCGVLGISVLITKSSESDTQMQELVSDRNPQLGFPNLQIEDELKPDNSGCIELEQKEDQLKLENNGCGDLGIRGLRSSGGGSVAKKSLDEFVKDWVERKVNAGVDKRNCVLPFLIHAPKSVECSVCQGLIFPGDEVECSVRDCMGVFHLECAKERLGLSSPKMFKCPQHVCYVCNKKIHLWRCIRCPLASHDKCAAFPEHVVHLNDQPGRVICWKHPSDWRLEKVNLFICSSTQFYFY
uniref:Zinc finger PHD-type domain-containing protein n=1 Tax=Solanum lycopersicum TaxID=4081 RepID=A0A3Q7H691_SOLLC